MTDDELRRADARANRDRILDVARKALAANPHASLNAICKAAGVGAGTLYRHFPTREALLVGVYHREVTALASHAEELLVSHPPLEALRWWCERFVRIGSVKQGIAETLHAAVSDIDLQETYQLLADALRRLMNSASRQGLLSDGDDPEVVLTLLSSLLRVKPDPRGESIIKAALDLIFRGLSTAR